MNLYPRNRFVFLETLSNWGESGIIRQNLSVALHTGLSRGNIGKPTLVYVIVAISTINAHLARMNLVRESNRLDRLVPHPSIFRGKIIRNTCDNTGASYQSAHQKDQRQAIGPFREDVRHPKRTVPQRILRIPALSARGFCDFFHKVQNRGFESELWKRGKWRRGPESNR